MAYQQGKFTSS